MLARFWNALRREPLVHFLALAALLFVTYDLLMPSGTGAARHRPGQHRRAHERSGGPARPTADRRGAQLGRRARDRRRGAAARGLQARPGPGRCRAAASGAEDALRPGRGGAPTERGGAQSVSGRQSRALPRAADSDARPRVLRRSCGRAGRASGAAAERAGDRGPRRSPVHARRYAAPLYRARPHGTGRAGSGAARVRGAGRRVAGPRAVRARRAFHARGGAPSAEHAELCGAGELSPPGLDDGAAAARGRRQARRAAPGVPDRGRATP